MNSRIIIILLAIIVSLSTYSAESSNVVLTFVQFNNEEVVVYSAPRVIVKAQENWVPGQGDVPLGMSEALKIARLNFKNEELHSIRLAKKDLAEREVWFYIFGFMGQKQAVVLMSGYLAESETINKQDFFEKLRSQ